MKPATIIEKLQRIDQLLLVEYDKENKLNKTPKYWHNFFSGNNVTLTTQGVKVKQGIQSRINKLDQQSKKLLQTITLAEAIAGGYCCDGVCDWDFKQE